MISVSEAKQIIQKNVQALQPVKCNLSRAVGLTLAADVYASVDIPAFPQSSMDGYALSFNDLATTKELSIDGEIAAGSDQAFQLAAQKVVRIFTGAAVPPGADTVVMQEKTRTENGKLIIEDDKLRIGTNVRPQGSEIKAGSLALPKGTRLSPAAIGFLANIGVTQVSVYPHPSVTIVITGNELQHPGNPLKGGQVYDSNSFTLPAALDLMNIDDIHVEWVHDDLEAVTNVLQKSLNGADVVLLTGGISVGNYDFVLPATRNCGVVELFHKVKQRPGKPLYFGMKNNKLVFGLPGNPSSVLTCFYMYVTPALEQISNKSFGIQTLELPIGATYKKDAGLTHFLKGKYNGNAASPLDAQESYRMRSFAEANCLIQLDEDVTNCEEGTSVKVHLLPI